MQILLSPDCDDEGLFATYILNRTKAQVIVVCDGVIHEERFGKERGVLARRKESQEACHIMGVPVSFLGLSDKTLTLTKVVSRLDGLSVDRVFAPSYQGGNKNHDIVSIAAHVLFGDKVLYYSTYAKEDFTMKGEMALHPSPEEVALKDKVLSCYKSQHGINAPHFDAVRNVPEFLNIRQC